MPEVVEQHLYANNTEFSVPISCSLIAQMLERIYAQLRAKSRGSDVPLNGVCKRIASEMTQWRCSHPQALYKYVVRRRNAKDTQMNPIQVRFCL